MPVDQLPVEGRERVTGRVAGRHKADLVEAHRVRPVPSEGDRHAGRCHVEHGVVEQPRPNGDRGDAEGVALHEQRHGDVVPVGAPAGGGRPGQVTERVPHPVVSRSHASQSPTVPEPTAPEPTVPEPTVLEPTDTRR